MQAGVERGRAHRHRPSAESTGQLLHVLLDDSHLRMDEQQALSIRVLCQERDDGMRHGVSPSTRNEKSRGPLWTEPRPHLFTTNHSAKMAVGLHQAAGAKPIHANRSASVPRLHPLYRVNRRSARWVARTRL